jgi:uncharacterized membrane-anchored protein YhcB (DUF1043 family)
MNTNVIIGIIIGITIGTIIIIAGLNKLFQQGFLS